jgi:hypothetical protein
VIAANIFIDCTYEGDLMAKAGVSYTYGREAMETHGESLAGVRPNLTLYEIDLYNKPGDPSSGLIPLVQDRTMGPLGSADKLTMGYGFRWEFSTNVDRLPIEPPEDYDPRTFELFRRGMQHNIAMNKGRRIRMLGRSDYPDGDWKVREKIWKAQQDFMRGMTHFLRTDSVVSSNLKQQALAVGFKPGMFDEMAGWPHQMYIREARRMKSAYVVTQKNLEGATDPEDSIGLASYGADDWPYATFPFNGKIALNGGEFSILYLEQKHSGIYPTLYRAITPSKSECDNLIVPVCCSASHIAMTSIRTISQIRILLADWLTSNAESREPVAEILKLLEPLDAYIRGELSRSSSSRSKTQDGGSTRGGGTTYTISSRRTRWRC